jgi:serine-type D-Ala-D-Ala carboxypeptidase
LLHVGHDALYHWLSAAQALVRGRPAPSLRNCHQAVETKMGHESTLDTESVDLRAVAVRVVDAHQAAPCAVVGAARRVGVSEGFVRPSWRYGWGAAGKVWSHPPAGRAAEAPKVNANHIFDLASLTKPVVALTLARLERAGRLSRAERLGDLLPSLADTPAGRTSLDLLCAHRAGLEAHRPFFSEEAGAKQRDRAEVLREAACARRPDCQGEPPEHGFAPIYSDLGYMLVGEALATREALALDELVAREVSRPLGLTLGSIAYLAQHEPMAERRIVPTEVVPWRGGVVHAVVHDENAWLLADKGIAGHAGLFGEIWSVVRLGCAVLDALSGRKTTWLDRANVEPLLQARPGGSHAAGFDLRSDDNPSSGSRFGPGTFGHLGFTGTSIWLDPDAAMVAVMLTNRVHPSRAHLAIRAARPDAYDAMFDAMV